MSCLCRLIVLCVIGAFPVLGCSETPENGGTGATGGGGAAGSGGTAGAGGTGGGTGGNTGAGGEAGTSGSGGIGGAAGAGGVGGVGGAPECEGNEACDDGNECTEGTCIAGACDHREVEDRTACADGECLDGVCAIPGAHPCTAQGILDAIAAGGGPHYFACDGSTPVVSGFQIAIDNDVILDGQGNLTVDGNLGARVFVVPSGVTAELRGVTVTRGRVRRGNGGGIRSEGTLTLVNSTVSQNEAWCESSCWGVGFGGGIYSTSGFGTSGTLRLTNSTVSGNSASTDFGGIYNGFETTMTLTNSTVSDNTGGTVNGIWNDGTLTLTNSTVSGPNNNVEITNQGTMTVTNSLVDGSCLNLPISNVTSNGYNIESPGDTCGFDPDGTDQVNVAADDLNLGPLADNGRPTMTHALQTDPLVSTAIDQIPEAACDVDTDQRGEPRPVAILGPEPKCDVGAFERQPDDQ